MIHQHLEVTDLLSRYELFSTSISILYHDIQKIERIEMAKFGLKGPHAQCLLAMSRYPEGITAAQLCELTEKDKAAISRTVAEMEEAGLLYRVERNGLRYRAQLVLTEKGAAAARQVEERATQVVAQASPGMSDEQRAFLYKALEQIAQNLHTLCKEGISEK